MNPKLWTLNSTLPWYAIISTQMSRISVGMGGVRFTVQEIRHLKNDKEDQEESQMDSGLLMMGI